MPIATSTALLIGAASAAGSVGGAAINARAAGKAAKTQSSAALEASRIQDQSLQRAEAEQRRLYEARVARNAPYQQAGQESINAMRGIMNQGPNWNAPGEAPAMPPRPEGVNRLRPIMAAGSGQTPAAAAQAPMVTMKAPTGQVKQVPAEQVQYFAQRGAQVVR